jgi:hypothetical protein
VAIGYGLAEDLGRRRKPEVIDELARLPGVTTLHGKDEGKTHRKSIPAVAAAGAISDIGRFKRFVWDVPTTEVGSVQRPARGRRAFIAVARRCVILIFSRNCPKEIPAVKIKIAPASAYPAALVWLPRGQTPTKDIFGPENLSLEEAVHRVSSDESEDGKVAWIKMKWGKILEPSEIANFDIFFRVCRGLGVRRP